MAENKQILIIYLLLTVTTLIAFQQVGSHGFVNFDDDVYVTANRHVRNGITIEGLRWAFTTGHAANWHPLTWISHMMDIQFFGLNPRWHHLTNLLLHIANVLLLFFVLHRMSKALWRSAFVAALFALHPFHVESVAWIAERKDVLSTFFWMLTLVAYAHYAERRRTRSYLAVAAFMTLGLMAKPMLVTLPFVLLLLDFWPLERFGTGKSAQPVRMELNNPVSVRKRKATTGKHTPNIAVEMKLPANPKLQRTSIGPLVLEKIPLFALTVLSCAATYIAQNKAGAVTSIEIYTPAIRMGNAFVSYIIYITKMLWPVDLAVFYPLPKFLPLWQVLGAALLLIVATFAVLRTARRFPYLPVGWLWFTGTLVPVIGIVQVGDQGMADRYTYIPSIGLFIIAAWGVPRLLKKRPYGKEVLAATSALCLLCLLILTRTQVGYWRDAITLFDHTLNITQNNYPTYINRGMAYKELGNYTRAIEDFNRAIELIPQYAEVYNSRGVAYAHLGNCTQAVEDFTRAVTINPRNVDAYYNRGEAYGYLGDNTRAIRDFDRAVEINPLYAEAYSGRGIAYKVTGDFTRAIADLGRAIEINPEYVQAYNNRGTVFAITGNPKQALEDFNRAVEINPQYAEAYFNRGLCYQSLGQYREAIDNFDRTVELYPKNSGAYYQRGKVHTLLGNQTQALEDMKTAAKLGHTEAGKLLQSRGID